MRLRRFGADTCTYGYGLGVALLFGFATRMVLLGLGWGAPDSLMTPDSAGYLQLAAAFPRSVSFTPGSLLTLSLLRTPGYPAMLALISSFGLDLSSVLAVQVGLSLVTVALVAAMGKTLAGPLVGAAGALFLALDPASMIYSTLALSETLFALVLTAAVYVLLILARAPRLWLAAASGLLLAVAILTRPIGLFLPVALTPVLWLLLRTRQISSRRTVTLAAAFLLAALIPAFGWALRNDAVADVRAVSTIDGLSLYYYKAAGAIAAEEQRPLTAVQAELEKEEREAIGEDPPVTSEREFRRQRGAELLRSHPTGAVESTARGAARLLVGPSRAPFLSRMCGSPHPCGAWTMVLLAAQVGIVISTVLAAAWGAVVAARERRQDLLILGATIAVLVALSAGPEAYSRFRVPVMPFIAVLAGYGAVTGVRGVGWRRGATGNTATLQP